MARARGFNEADAVRSAAQLFTRHGYEGTSVDDLVAHLGVHRGSLYRTFGSKLALFHRALRNEIEEQVLPWISGQDDQRAPMPADPSASVPDLGLILVACMELCQSDPVVRVELRRIIPGLGGAEDDSAYNRTALVLGWALLVRAGLSDVSMEKVT
jgi:TetR/AcrR family transcriptional repressor of nem operon